MLKKQERQHKKKTFTLKGKKKGNTTITQSARIHTEREKKGPPNSLLHPLLSFVKCNNEKKTKKFKIKYI